MAGADAPALRSEAGSAISGSSSGAQSLPSPVLCILAFSSVRPALCALTWRSEAATLTATAAVVCAVPFLLRSFIQHSALCFVGRNNGAKG